MHIISEVGGSESAFRQPPPEPGNRFVTCSCVCARGGMLGGSRVKSSSAPISLFFFSPRSRSLFPLGSGRSSLFPETKCETKCETERETKCEIIQV